MEERGAVSLRVLVYVHAEHGALTCTATFDGVIIAEICMYMRTRVDATDA